MSASEASSLQVVNNFVEVQHLPELLRSRGGWCYGIYPGLLGDVAPSWHIHLCGSRKAHERAIHDDVLAATPGMEPLHEIWTQIKENLAQDYGLVRAYVTGHTHGQDGVAHHYAKPSDQERVALLYASAEWKDDWAGETVFYDTARECISIRPRPGRLVVFDGAVTRASRAPARECPTLCSTITFHMRRVRR